MKALYENMTKRDGLLLGAVVALTFIATYTVDRLVKAAEGEDAAMAITGQADMGTVVLMALMLVAAIVVSYRCVRIYGGTVGKGFYMFIWGFLFQLALPIEVAWHLIGLQSANPMVGPAWLGVPSYAWLGFFHTMIAASVALMGYGLYILVRDLEGV